MREMRFAFRALCAARGFSLTVVLTLALGIGANAAIFALVRGVLLRPLPNREEARIVYIRQSARAAGVENATFSMPEIADLRARLKSFTALADFSTASFAAVGFGEPREVRAGVVSGTYFDVMGLRPVLGRLLDARDDGPAAAGAVVLTYRFWSVQLKGDRSVVGKVVRLGTRSAVVAGVLEASPPYPADTDVIVNTVTSPHHLSATMVTGRIHRMTELFGKLAPGAGLEQARAELRAVHAAMMKEHAEAYGAGTQIDATRLRDQITMRARPVLLVLMAASALVFVVACANAANLILARSVRRENELAIRAALGASSGALRRTLLAESLLLSGAGAAASALSARPMLGTLARYASRYSVRALDLTVDWSMVWVAAGMALGAAVLLAFVPRLPSAERAHGFGLAAGGMRSTRNSARRQRAFAITQIAASFLLLAGASVLIQTLISLQAAETGIDTRRVLAVQVPVMAAGRTPEQITEFYQEVVRRVGALPGVEGVGLGSAVPWRDAGRFGPGFQFSADGHVRGSGEEDPRGRFRTATPGFFAALGIPIVAGRDFNDGDRRGGEAVVIVSQSLARRLFPNQEAVNRSLVWTDPMVKFVGVSTTPRRIVGVAADFEDESLTPGPAMTVYHPFAQEQLWGGRLFVRAASPGALAGAAARVIRELSAEQVVERAATLEEIRAEVLTPDRLSALVFGGIAAVALGIAAIGVAGVQAFSVSGRTREFGIRMAVGSSPGRLLAAVIGEGAAMCAAGIAAGGIAGAVLAQFVAGAVAELKMPGWMPLAGSAAVLLGASIVASALPAARAACVDVVRALRAE